jgi:putative nucleotidyltransferase with HDIG domain
MGPRTRSAEFGKGLHTIDTVCARDLLAHVLQTFRALTYQPPLLPATALELMTLSRSSETTFEQVSTVLEKDPLVAARVLKLAQSAYFSRGARVQSLKDAVVRLGLQTLADLFLEVTMTMRVFRAPGFDEPMTQLRRHSAVTAHLTRVVCRRTSISDEYGFLCGILHDVGVAAAAGVIGRTHPYEVAWPVVLEVHAEAGGAIARAWGLPPDVTLVVAQHHSVRVNGFVHPVACAVAVADWLAHEVGCGLEGQSTDGRPELELRTLSLESPPVVAALIDDAKKIAARFV